VVKSGEKLRAAQRKKREVQKATSMTGGKTERKRVVKDGRPIQSTIKSQRPGIAQHCAEKNSVNGGKEEKAGKVMHTVQ